MVPATQFHAKQRQGKKQKQQDVDILGNHPSTSEVLKDYLIYWTFSKHAEWRNLSGKEFIKLVPGATEELGSIWNEVSGYLTPDLDY